MRISGEADNSGTELCEEAVPSWNEDGAISNPEARDLSQSEIGKIWRFSKIQQLVLKLLIRKEIAHFAPMDNYGKFLVRLDAKGVEGLILLGILQGSLQAVPHPPHPKTPPPLASINALQTQTVLGYSLS